MTKWLNISWVERVTTDGDVERLEFQSGVNTIYGRKDAGKTVWLDMIDFWLGGTKTPAETFGSEVAEKYSILRGVIVIDFTNILLERRWHERGSHGKVYVDGEPFDTKEFSGFILKKLDIPQLHYPKGSPYADRKWPELSWKTIYRHLYRHENSWSNLAEGQFDSDQFATLALFLGVAEKLFSDELGELVQKEKERSILEARKLEFQSILDQITARLSSPESPIQFATADILQGQIFKLEEKINMLVGERENVLSISASKAIDSQLITTGDIALSERRSLLIAEHELLERERQTVTKRRVDIEALKNSVADEVDRLRRAKLAGSLLDEIRVTNCPVCDQKVSLNRGSADTCYLCLQYFSESDGNARLDFEIHQMTSEAAELKELLNQLSSDENQILLKLAAIKDQLSKIDRDLAPARSKTAGLIDFRLGSLDAQRGRLEEQVEVFKRLLDLLGQRDKLSEQIDELSVKIATLVLHLTN